MVVSLGDDDVAGLGVDERRVVDESFVEANQTPLIEEESAPAWAYDRVVRVAVQYRAFTRRWLRPAPTVSHRSLASVLTHLKFTASIGICEMSAGAC